MKHLSIAGVIVVLMGAAPVPIAAQGVASSFEQLAVLVAPGDRIAAFDDTGTRVDGRVGTVSRGRLMLVTSKGPLELAEGDVAQIRQRRGDSLKNGALIGFASAGAFYLTIVPKDEGTIPGKAIVGVTIVALGAAAGTGIDALIKRSQVIYQRPGHEGGARLTPLFGRGRRGAAITFRF